MEHSHMKGAGMLVVSLRGVNFRFWSHFIGCSGQNTIIFSRKGLFRVALKKILKIIYFQFVLFTLLM